MPIYHFTFHTYGTWLPDRPEGYTPHGQGHQLTNPHVADAYRQRMNHPQTHLNSQAQQFAIQTLLDSQYPQRFELYALASEGSHLHVVIAWQDEREPIRVRTQIKTSMSLALNKRFGRRQWFVAKAGHIPVADEAHLHELVHQYLPKHGLYWKRGDNNTNQR